MTSDHADLLWRHQTLQWDVEYWYSYVSQGLAGEIQGHSRKDQRTYQRHFCNFYSRLHRFRATHPELLL